jgi:hypothetical protein
VLPLNSAPRHEGLLGSGGTVARILDPGNCMEESGQLHAPVALLPA